MLRRLRAVGFVALISAILLPTLALAAERVALVIGNSRYDNLGTLRNPRNDARSIATALERLDFKVTLGIDMTRTQMWLALRDFAGAVEDSKVALFYYAGHGIQKDQINYLIPRDAQIETAIDLPAFAVGLNSFLQPLQSSKRINLVFLDACRDNPLPEAARSRSIATADGLAPIHGEGGMLIAYATDPHRVAADGEGDNSPFTEAMLAEMETPGLEIRELMVRVREHVLAATGGQQRPWTEDGLDGRFFFRPKAEQPAAVVAGPAEPAPVTPLDARGDLVMWTAIRNTQRREDYELFLTLYPESPLRPLAETRLAMIQAGAAAAEEPQLASLEPSDGPGRSLIPSTGKGPPENSPEEAASAPRAPREPTPVIATLAPDEHTTKPPPAPEEPTLETAALTPGEPATTQPLRDGPTDLSVQPDEAELVVIEPRGVNVRLGPGTQHEKIGYLAPGSAVRITGTAEGGTWYRFTDESGRTAYVYASLLGAAGTQPAGGGGPRAPGEVFRDCPVCPELVAVPGGRFRLGSPDGEPMRRADEGPTRDVVIGRPLAAGRTEVTHAQWEACVADGGCSGYTPDDEGWGGGQNPVVNVGYKDALGFAKWLSSETGKSYRLPSEAEWEFLARAGDSGATPWDEDPAAACRFANVHDTTSRKLNRFSWDSLPCSDQSATPAAVGSFAPNPFGLYDTLGNVWEWTADCYRPSYDRVRADGTANSDAGCGEYVLRGGGWRDRPDRYRFAARTSAGPDSRTSVDGFRVVRALDEGLKNRDAAPTVATR